MPVKGGQVGNSGGKKGRSGRKSKAEEMGLQALLDKCWASKDREACIKKLAKMALTGDIAAIKLLMEYTFGKPVQVVAGEPNLPFEVIVRREPRRGTTSQAD